MFKQALLLKISVTTSGLDNSLALREALAKAYGQPVESESSSLVGPIKRYEWKGDHCDLVFTLEPSGNGDAEFTSADVQQEVDARMADAKAQRGQEAEDKVKQAQSHAVENSKNL